MLVSSILHISYRNLKEIKKGEHREGKKKHNQIRKEGEKRRTHKTLRARSFE
jgi:hypothetical protein